MSEVLLTIQGKPVFIDHGEHVWWNGEMTIDADGSPRAYGPEGTDPLDYLGNAGYPGNWWGIATYSNEPDGEPVIQGKNDPCPGYYVSTTAYLVAGYKHTDPRRYLNSETICFAVIPGNVRKATVGICKGCKARITDKNKGKVLNCVIGDIGPSDHMGEASIAVAKFFGINPDPKKGGSSDTTRWQYECWPGVAAEGYTLQ
jgi:Fungal chitosanase of glycosyl hydrolase group 75